MEITVPVGGAGQGSQMNSTSALVTGVMAIGGAVFAFAISATTHNSDPTDFFYDIDNQASTMFAVFGLITLLIGLFLIGYSFKLKNDEEQRFKMQAEAEEAARTKAAEEAAKAARPSIMVRCRYCGTLNAETDAKCVSCGATL